MLWLAHAALTFAGLFACREEKKGDDVYCHAPDAGTCATPLAETDSEGAPWPSHSEALDAAHGDCSEYRVSVGTCSDGKVYVARNGGFVGDVRYFNGETLVGARYWGDIGFCECVPGQATGDVSCPGQSEMTLCSPLDTADAGSPRL